MIDFSLAEKAFKEFLSKYDIENSKIKLKIVHTYQVVNVSEYIAKELHLKEEEIQLAKLIGLLHDIGRFEQIKQYNSFKDRETIDHANLGIKILFEDHLIRKFIIENTYDSIIYEAIKNHNKYHIEEGLTQEELLYAKIIRDADKVDIYRASIAETIEDFCECKKEEIENSLISDKIYQEFMNKHNILRKDVQTHLDSWVVYFSFIFDYNFIASFRYIKEKEYINKMVDKINYKIEDTKQKMETIRNLSNAYIEEKIFSIK